MCRKDKKNVINEAQYKLMRLEKIIPQLDKKRIVIYGVGINAKRVLDSMPSLNILGLMDSELTGKYIYGKKVLTQEEVKLLGVDTILIAANPDATQIVYERIKSFCVNNHIAILDMYGCDEFLLHKKILEQELDYPNMEEEKLKSYIDANEVLVISLKNVLCSEIISEEKLFYEKMEKCLEKEGVFFQNFARKRILAGKRAGCGTEVNRKVIYGLLSTMMSVNEKEIEHVKKIEERLALENLVPRTKMIELLKYAISQKKEVYIFSDLLDGERMMDTFFEPYGVSQYKKVLASSDRLTNILGVTIRTLGEQHGYENILCLGSNVSGDLIIPQLYNVNFQLIQGSLDTFFKVTELQINRDFIKHNSKKDELIKDILEKYNTPFLNQIDCKSYDKVVAEKIGWIGEEGCIDVELLPVKLFRTINEINKISFPISDKPYVSIIILTYNRFEYTYNCLKSILLNTDNIAYEVIVADNGSCDFTSKLEEFVSGITVIHNHRSKMRAKVYNDTAKVANGKYLVFLDNDTQVQVNWLYPLIKCMETKKNIGMVGGKLVFHDGSLQEAGGIVWNNGYLCKYGKEKKPDAPEYCYVREVDYVSGTAMMILKELWDDIGGLDETYTFGYYDVDLAYEVRKREKEVLYQPDSIVMHFRGENIEENSGWNSDREKFLRKWKFEILKNQNMVEQNILSASERKQSRKTVMFVSEHVPTYDKDAGSRTIDFYIQEFLKRGYIVKFIPADFMRSEPYTYRLEQKGVEVLGGDYYKKTIINWICSHYREIDFVFLNYPDASEKYIDAFKKFEIPVMYYGVDLHYLRTQREYELLGNKDKAEKAKLLYAKEAYLIKNSDVVYYPSLVETEIVKKEFYRSDVKQLMINIYDIKNINNTYIPNERGGIMFIGSYGHAPNVDAIRWFSDYIFPQIYKRLRIPFYIVGSNMPKDLIKTGIEGIEVLGALTDLELEEMYNNVKMVVVPLRYGAGIKGKVIEAMYYGIPVVTTSIGIEGIPNEEDAVRVVDGEDEFAETVIDLYQTDERLKKMSVAGQNIIKRYYSCEAAWDNIAKDFS